MANYIPVEPIPRLSITVNRHILRRATAVSGALLLLGIMSVGGLQLGWRSFNQKVDKTVAAVSRPEVAGVSTVQPTPPVDPEPAIAAVLAAHPELTVGVRITDLTTGSTVRINERQIFTAASVTKVLTAAAVLTLVDQHKLSLQQKLAGLPLQEQLRLMINQSDNDAWARLHVLVGAAVEQKYAQDIGLVDFNLANNQISAADVAMLWQKLYRRQLLTEASTQLLLGWMTKTNEERLIPAAVPGATVYHKYGWLDGNVHDAAIIDGPHPLLVVMLTNNPNDGNLPARSSVFGDVTRASLQAVNSGW